MVTAQIWLVVDAVVRCEHLGNAPQQNSQSWVRVTGKPVLVDPDPQGRSINLCPNYNPLAGIKPCTNTLPVQQGKSSYIKIDGHQVMRADMWGLTDGTPPGAVKYQVHTPGQSLVGEAP
jgi:hypothetical protein